MYSIVITNRNEPHLNDTIMRAIETSDCAEVIVVNDGACKFGRVAGVRYETPWKTAKGLQPARDYGIEIAAHDHVILMDAHMQFRDGSGWADQMTAHLVDPTTLVCATCLSVCPSSYRFVEECDHCRIMRERIEAHGAKAPAMPKARYGARLQLLESSKDEHKIFASHWVYDAPGEKQSILGGCYALSRDWYMQGLRRPWRNMRAWGMSEQTLSVINWLFGGRSVCDSAEVGHLFRRSGKVPYECGTDTRQGLEYNYGIWLNRYRLLDVLPMSPELRERMHYQLNRNHVRSGMRRRVDAWMTDRSCDEELKRALADCGKTLDDYAEAWDCDTE